MHIPNSSGPHGQQEILVSGNTSSPTQALILLHGRGSSAQNILTITRQIDIPDTTIILAPQASTNTWYPQRFIVAQGQNQPHLDSAVERIATVIQMLSESFSLATTSIILAGFSQGACLVAEYAKRHPSHYKSIHIWSGGLIGTDDEVDNDVPGSYNGTPIRIGCDREDFHIPVERIYLSSEYFVSHQGKVTSKLYDNLGHTVHPDEFKILGKYLNKD